MPLTDAVKDLVLHGNTFLLRRDYAAAIRSYNEALRLDPDCAPAYHNRAVARHAQDDPAGAIADCDQALRVNPQYAEAYSLRGDARRTLGDLTGAAADQEKAVTLAPQSASVFNNRGTVRYEQGDAAGAIADFDRALALRERSWDYYLNRAAARRYLGDLAGAEADCDVALRLNPDAAACHVQKGAVLHARRQFQAAIAEYDRTLAIDPGFYSAYILRASARYHLLDTTGSKADFIKGLELNLRGAARLVIHTIAEMLSRDPAETFQECAAHLARDPDDFLSYARRGLAYLLLGQPEAAQQDLDRFHELLPDRGPLFQRLVQEAQRRQLPAGRVTGPSSGSNGKTGAGASPGS